MTNKLLFVLMLAVLAQPSCQSQENAPPNVIVIFTDDQGYADLGCYGAEGFQTPNIDALAADGLRFTNFYVPASLCTPSRAALLTGRYPKRSNLHEMVLFPYSEGGLPLNEYTMAELLSDRGYTTSCIGKWHLGHREEYLPTNQGFDNFYGVPYSNDMDRYYYEKVDFQSPPLPLMRNTEVIESGPDQSLFTRTYTDEVVAHIKNRSEQPFFIYLAHTMPHVPLYVTKAFEGKSELGLYGDVIMELDWSVGEIVRTLKEEGIYDNTIIVFASDNGPDLGSAKPLRGKKFETWEGGQRVPGIIVWNDHIAPNQVSDQFVSTLDLYPTIANLCRATTSEDQVLDGRDISKLLLDPLNTQLDDRPFYYYAPNGEIEAVRLGDWKLHIVKSWGWDEASQGAFEPALYNLVADIGEKRNVADQNPDIVDELRELIESVDHSAQ